VLITANDYNRGLLNGERARVDSVDVERSRITLATADDRVLTVSALWAGEHLSLGYALTCHKAQGQTADITLVAGSTALTREVTYTALSRGRSANNLYLAPENAVDSADSAAQAWITDHVLADAGHRISTSRRQTLATELRPHSPPIPPIPDRQVPHTLGRS
jgi:ATP-dependent exoDNAse (exonuclease V) alpha subunit